MTQKKRAAAPATALSCLAVDPEVLSDRFCGTWLRLRVTLEGLRRTRATIDADFHCRMADERDDSDGYYCKQEFHLALLPGLWFVALRLVY